MTTREKIDLMTKINVANEQRIAEYLINGHEVTQTSPVTLDLASMMAKMLRDNKPMGQYSFEILRDCARCDGYDPDIIEKAVRSVGGQR